MFKKDKNTAKKAAPATKRLPVKKLVEKANPTAKKPVAKHVGKSKGHDVPNPTVKKHRHFDYGTVMDTWQTYKRDGKLSARAFIRAHIKLPLSKLAEKMRDAGYYPGISDADIEARVAGYRYHIEWELAHATMPKARSEKPKTEKKSKPKSNPKSKKVKDAPKPKHSATDAGKAAEALEAAEHDSDEPDAEVKHDGEEASDDLGTKSDDSDL